MQDIEKIITKTKKILDDNILAQLQALESEYADDIALPKPEVYTSSVLSGEDPETIIIGAINTEVIGEQDNYNLSEHAISVTVWLVETESLVILTKKVFRYIRAILEILAEKFQLGTTVLRNTINSIDYSPIYNIRKIRSFFKGATITLVVTIEQFI